MTDEMDFKAFKEWHDKHSSEITMLLAMLVIILLGVRQVEKCETYYQGQLMNETFLNEHMIWLHDYNQQQSMFKIDFDPTLLGYGVDKPKALNISSDINTSKGG